ncbi:60S acidic ribosomal protein family [Arabidopsis thaliana]|uniref:60S acidic ribosomal protein family n=1 Tax=Arabidopsis thaliana TaxID=3702 RepID=F4IGR4_ARATH|nr:60S acidic ribosomal protein family [Arabidopsis thaliana]AEC08034.1 60S acidic ribosomal protein family [Arabidopsis thaliana]|eukprot:NP_001154535.1 60S acidic ribosomal protein family [Arabidopsis thaliana]
MKVVAAFLLAVLSGKASPTTGDIKDILGSGIMVLVLDCVVIGDCFGAETEDSQIELLLKEVKGKDLAELIAAGREKLASVPSGGGGGVAVASATSGGGGGGGAPAAESKKEEKKEEKEESDDDMGFSLFE